MKKARVVAGFLILFCSLALVGGVLAANGAAIERSVFSSGGEQATDGNLYVLNGTLGEPIAGAVTLGTSYGLGSGFWWLSGEFKIYLPLVLRNHL
jgi:hypothetical protein